MQVMGDSHRVELKFVVSFINSDSPERSAEPPQRYIPLFLKSSESSAGVSKSAFCISSVIFCKNGEIASLSSAINVLKPETGYIYGTKGYIELPCFYGAQEVIVNVNNEVCHIPKPSIGDGFEEEIYEVCSCISDGKTQSDIMPMSKSIKILEQMDYIREQIDLKYPFDVRSK